MNDILSLYLESLEQDSSDLKKLTFGKPMIIFSKTKDISTGLLKFKKDQVSKNLRFLFVFPNEAERVFHTVGMKFNIDIYFFDKDGALISKKINCPPGVEDIKSKGPCKYVVENLSDEEEED
jgi:uncharacterized membrane protein (UPF0127 family)